MDIGILSHRHAPEIILAVGDDPGHTIRHYTTVPTDKGGAPSPTLQMRVIELADAGILAVSAGMVRGKPARLITLTDKGATIYRLLDIIRGL